MDMYPIFQRTAGIHGFRTGNVSITGGMHMDFMATSGQFFSLMLENHLATPNAGGIEIGEKADFHGVWKPEAG